jgi:hypothetical protein
MTVRLCLTATEEVSLRATCPPRLGRRERGNLRRGGGGNRLYCKIGNNCLPQGDAAIVTGHLPVGKNLEAAAFQ